MITERTLRKWRTDALTHIDYIDRGLTYPDDAYRDFSECCERILRLTQELLDQHLLRKEKKRND